MMKDIRSWMGKHMKPNQEAMLTRLALMLAEHKKARVGAGRSNPSIPDIPSVKMIAVTKVFACTAAMVDEMNIFGQGPVKYGTLGKGEFKAKSDSDSNSLFTPSGRTKLTDECLFWYSTGLERDEQYIDEYYFKNPNQIKRPNSQANVQRIPVRKQDAVDAAELEKIFHTSMDPRYLDVKEFTKDDLASQVDIENSLLPKEFRIKPPSFSSRKSMHVHALVDIRKRISEHTDIELEVPAHKIASKRTKEDRAKELELPFYHLTYKAREKYASMIFFKDATMDNDNDSDEIDYNDGSEPQQQSQYSAGSAFSLAMLSSQSSDKAYRK
eukprot:scaffold8061_cov61-Attheya_sp.AAC.1